MIDLTTLTARKVADAVRRRELTAVAVTEAALERIDKLNPTLHAFITVMKDEALAAAAEVDRKLASGQGAAMPLAGVPTAIKDSFWTREFAPPAARRSSQTSFQARMPRLWRGSETQAASSWASRRCTKWPMVSPAAIRSTETATTPGTCRASPAAAAAGMRPHSPRAWCLPPSVAIRADRIDSRPRSVASSALKVTYGRVSRHGGIPLSWSMDTVGPMARTVGDAAALLSVMAGLRPQGHSDATRRSSQVFECFGWWAERHPHRRAARSVPCPNGAGRRRSDPGLSRRSAKGGSDARRRAIPPARPGCRGASRDHLQRGLRSS